MFFTKISLFKDEEDISERGSLGQFADIPTPPPPPSKVETELMNVIIVEVSGRCLPPFKVPFMGIFI